MCFIYCYERVVHSETLFTSGMQNGPCVSDGQGYNCFSDLFRNGGNDSMSIPLLKSTLLTSSLLTMLRSLRAAAERTHRSEVHTLYDGL